MGIKVKKMRDRKIVFLLFITVFVAFLCVGCSTSKEIETDSLIVSEDGENKEPKELKICYDITTELDPAFYTLFEDQARVHQIYNALIRYKPGTSLIESELADRWEVSNDGKTYTFYLKEGVKWHKGYGEFTAHDVEFSFNRVMNPETNSPNIALLKSIENIEVINDYTISITFNTSSPDVLYAIMPVRSGYIVCKKAVEEMGERYRSYPIGTGPYIFKEWLRDDRLVLEANPDYFEGPALIKNIVFVEIPENPVAEMALQQGEIDVLLKVEDGDVYNRFSESSDFNTYAPLVTSVRGVEFDTRKAPFKDIRVRKAIAHLIDKDAFVKVFCGGLGTTAVSPLSPLFQDVTNDASELPEYKYDPQEAKNLFAEAGVTELGKVVYQSGSIRDDLFTYIQDEARKIGIKLDLERVDGTTWTDMRSKGELAFSFFGLGPRPNANELLKVWKHSSSFPPGLNFSYYNGIDELIDKAMTETDSDKRAALYDEIQIILMKDLPAIPIYHYTFGEIVNKKVVNWYPRTTGSDYPLHLVDVK